MRRRRRWDEELLEERERPTPPRLAELDDTRRAGLLEELQSAGGNRAFQEVVGVRALQREAATAAAPAVTRPFMKIKGVRGPSKVKGFEGAFELERDYELEVSTPTERDTGMATGKRRYSDLMVVVRKSAGVTTLREALVRNSVFDEIEFVVPVEDGTETTKITKAAVVGIKDLGNGTVEIRFTFDKINWAAGDLTSEDAPRQQGR